MKILIASDLHGSLTAARALLDAYRREGAERLWLLGDILYHGPRNDLPDGYDPKGVIALLNAMKGEIFAVRGNCDAEVDQMVLEFPILAEYAVLPLKDGSAAYLTHGHHYHEKNLPPLGRGDLLIHGHTHVTGMTACDNGAVCLNPGSLSIPKEGTPPAYIVYEGERFTLCRLDDGSVLAKWPQA
jgi:putative phosphoesterase